MPPDTQTKYCQVYWINAIRKTYHNLQGILNKYHLKYRPNTARYTDIKNKYCKIYWAMQSERLTKYLQVCSINAIRYTDQILQGTLNKCHQKYIPNTARNTEYMPSERQTKYWQVFWTNATRYTDQILPGILNKCYHTTMYGKNKYHQINKQNTARYTE